MRLSHLLAISICGISTVACQVEEIDVPNEELFARSFIKEFGIADAQQDWNLATRVTANINPSAVAGAETISIYDRMPGSAGCQLAARFSATNTEFSFDFAKANTAAYVRATAADGSIILSSYYPISNGRLNIGSRTASRSESAATDASGILLQPIVKGGGSWDKGIGNFCYNSYIAEGGRACNYDYWHNLNATEYPGASKAESMRPILNIFNLYGLHTGSFDTDYLKGRFDDSDAGRPCSDLKNIVGVNGVFHEGIPSTGINKDRCNLNLYGDKLKPENGVIYTSQGNEIELEYVYGAGIFDNSFGYFYYPPEKENDVDYIMQCPKFLLMLDASPWNNTQRSEDGSTYKTFEYLGGQGTNDHKDQYYTLDGIDNFSGMRPANDIEAYENNPSEDKNVRYRSSFHKLVYYELDGNNNPIEESATYKFPEGYKSGFFVLVQGHQKIVNQGNVTNNYNNNTTTVPGEDFRFSIPWMNQLLGCYYQSQPAHGSTPFDKITLNFNGGSISDFTPHMSFVTYRWGNETVMGVEDGQYHSNDHDMNDILFFVRGVEGNQEEIGEEPDIQSWIIACEDLGSSHDFDFNDVVFGVSHYTTDNNSTNELRITALAAGGTLPVELYWTDRNNNDHRVGSYGGFVYWNEWFGVNDNKRVLNCYDSSSYTREGATVTIPLGTLGYGPGDYSIADTYFKSGADETNERHLAMGGFSLVVHDPAHPDTDGKRWVKPLGDYENVLNGESWYNAPQMILVDKSWKWPIENMPIFDAYSGYTTTGGYGQNQTGFKDWVQNKFTLDWTEHISDHSTVVNHNWQGQPVSADN